MSLEKGFIDHVKNNHPQMWALIHKTATESGLIIVDEENDAITASNRLLWTNPVLHECISTLVNEWANDHLFSSPEGKLFPKRKEGGSI
ncbi:hypothetical protein ACQZV8_02730 [Magnetococcales bacterium HHB-1]